MNRVGFVYHQDFLRHDTGRGHPERKERLEAVTKHLKEIGMLDRLIQVTPGPAPLEWIVKVHPEQYVHWVEQQCRNGETLLDGGDTHVCPESYTVALLACGSVLEAVDNVLSAKVSSAFCAVRPPGHHAETATAMGFCLLNNVAVGARYAQSRHSVGRIAIVDWDVHHGNGTQEIFYEDPSVLYISLHQYPLWPGTGAASDTGSGKGEGYTVNCPMRQGSGEQEYLAAFEEKILPALRSFRPELLLISAGFDAHKDDPLANIQLTEGSFGKMTKLVIGIADEYCEGRIVSVLEGGYNLNALAHSVECHLQTLMEKTA
ncbi:MAG: histone deacetylase [Bacteroidota bacterium]